MTDVNHQIRLAERPLGMLTPEVWEMTEEPLADAGRRAGAGGRRVALARPGDARLAQ